MSVDGSVPRRGSKLARVMSFRSLAGAGSDQKPFGQGSPFSWSVGVAGVGRDGAASLPLLLLLSTVKEDQ